MSNNDPERLSALPNAPELTDALLAARERLPDASALEAIRTRVEAAVGASAAPASTSARWPMGLKVILPLLGVVGVVVGTRQLARHSEAPAPGAAPNAFVISVPLQAPEGTPSPTLPLPPPLVASSPTPAIRQSLPPLVASARQSAAAPEVSSELDLVKRAGQVLKGDPARALQLTMDHARLYPGGALAEEREVIAIEALARLGRLSAARSRAERFMAAYPRSAHLSRVERAVQLGSNVPDAGTQKTTPPSTLVE